MPIMNVIQELEKIFKEQEKQGKLPFLLKEVKEKMIRKLAADIRQLPIQKRIQFEKLPKESKGLLMFAYCLATKEPGKYGFLVDDQKFLGMVLTPKQQLSLNERALLIKMMNEWANKLKNDSDKKMEPVLTPLHKKLKELLASLDLLPKDKNKSESREKEMDPRPLGGDPAFEKLFMDFETLTNISYFNMDPKTGRYQTSIPKVIEGSYTGLGIPLGDIKGDIPTPLSMVDTIDSMARGEKGALQAVEPVSSPASDDDKPTKSSLPNPLSTKPRMRGTKE